MPSVHPSDNDANVYRETNPKRERGRASPCQHSVDSGNMPNQFVDQISFAVRVPHATSHDCICADAALHAR